MKCKHRFSSDHKPRNQCILCGAIIPMGFSKPGGDFMKATSFLNADEVVIKTSDGSWFKLNEQESRKWINNFLYWVAGQGENTTNVKDGKIEDGNFVTSINTYHDIIPHKPVYL